METRPGTPDVGFVRTMVRVCRSRERAWGTARRLTEEGDTCALAERVEDDIDLAEQLGAPHDEEQQPQREGQGTGQLGDPRLGSTSASTTPRATIPKTIVTPAMKPVITWSWAVMDKRRWPSASARS